MAKSEVTNQAKKTKTDVLEIRLKVTGERATELRNIIKAKQDEGHYGSMPDAVIAIIFDHKSKSNGK